VDRRHWRWRRRDAVEYARRSAPATAWPLAVARRRGRRPRHRHRQPDNIAAVASGIA
jgi:hypothetical protein